MKNLNGILFYSVRESSYYLNISPQTIYNYIKFSNYIEGLGKAPIMPKGTIINNSLYYSMEDIEKKKKAKRHYLRRGSFMEFREYKNGIKESAKNSSVVRELRGGVR